MADVLTIKSGASIEWTLTFRSPDGTPFDLSTCTVTSQARDASAGFCTDLPIMLLGTIGTATVVVLDTSAFPIGMLQVDIKIVTSASVVLFSDTFGVRVMRSVTQ